MNESLAAEKIIDKFFEMLTVDRPYGIEECLSDIETLNHIDDMGGLGSTLLSTYVMYKSNSPDEDLDVLKTIISKGANVNHIDGMGNAVINYAFSAKFMQVLLDSGADVNFLCYQKRTALFTCRDAEVARTLINAGASVNHRDKKGKTPLMGCASVEVAKVLFDAGADINAKDNDDKTSLMYSHKPGNYQAYRVDMNKFLIESGADISAKDNKGNTPLMHAALMIMEDQEERVLQVVKYMIEKGADIYSMNNEGKTVYDQTCEKVSKTKLNRVHACLENYMLLDLANKESSNVNTKLDSYNKQKKERI